MGPQLTLTTDRLDEEPMRTVIANTADSMNRRDCGRPSSEARSWRLWLSGVGLFVLAIAWCRWNVGALDELRQTPSMDNYRAEDREPERQKPGDPLKYLRTADKAKVRLSAAFSREESFEPVLKPNEPRRSPAPLVDPNVQLCQGRVAASGPPLCAVDCGPGGACPAAWGAALPIDFQPYGPGEYVGHDRLAHVPAYRLRVDDQLECLYRLTREETTEPYKINVGDELQVESATDEKLNKNLIVQPDGTITLRLLGQVKATRTTVSQLRDSIETLYNKFYPMGAAITITPLKVNTRLEDLRATVDNRSGVVGGQGVRVRITPEGTITLPAIGTVPAQGLTLEELKVEIDHRYAATINGIEVTPVLAQRAPRFCYVLGEVRIPGRYILEGPTTLIQSIAMAGSWNVGANLQQVVVFRRADDWRLLATMVKLDGALRYANEPCPAGEIWLNDSDVVIVPKSKILLTDDFINLIFTRGVYGVLPFSTSYSWGVTGIR